MILTAQKLWVGAFDLTGDLSAMAFDISPEMQDDTVYGDSARSSTPGLLDFSHQHEGVWSAGAGLPDTVLYANVSLADVLATIAPVDGDAGSLAYFMRTTQGEYSFGGAVGELNRFSVSLAASGGVGAVRGSLLWNATVDATEDGTALELGAVGATGKLYAGLHVLSVSGTNPTLDAIVESDTASAFTTPVTRVTFSQATGATSEWATPVAGAITDTWWRVGFTLGGTASPEFSAVVVMGIQ